MRRFLVVVLVSAACLALSTTATAQGNCSFALGFGKLHDLIPQLVGSCREDEGHNPANGDGIQHTTGGMLVWRKADNWTAFTDGYRTWVNGPCGLHERLNSERFGWEACQPVMCEAAPFEWRPMPPGAMTAPVYLRTIRALPTESGWVSAQAEVALGEPAAGDTASNAEVRGFFSFDVGCLWNEQLNSALLDLGSFADTGAPGSLGALVVEAVDYGTLDPADFSQPATATLLPASDSSVRTYDVLSAVRTTLAEGRTRLQVRVRLAAPSNGSADLRRWGLSTAPLNIATW